MNISPNRITGMATGMDTDSMIKQMMKPYNMKYDKMKQDRQIIQWRQDLYRDILSDVSNFTRNYFDVLKRDSYMLSKDAFAAYSVDGISGNNVKISATSASKPGDYKIKIDQLAEGPKIEGTNVINKVTASTAEFGIKIDSNNNEFNVTLGDGSTTKLTIDINAITGYNRYNNAGELANELNTQLQSKNISDKVKAIVKDGKISFEAVTKIEAGNEITFSDGTNNYKVTLAEGNYTGEELAQAINLKLASDTNFKATGGITSTTDNGGVKFAIKGSDVVISNKNVALDLKTPSVKLKADLDSVGDANNTNIKVDTAVLKNTMIFSKEIITGFNDTLNVRIGDQLKTVTFDAKEYTDNVTLQTDLNNKLKASIDEADLKIEIGVDGKFNFLSTSGKQISIYGNASKVVGAYDNFEINMKSTNPMSNVIGEKYVKFRINDTIFEYDFSKDYSATEPIGAKNKTIDDILRDIKTKSGVDISYSQTTKKFTLSSSNTGSNSSVFIQDIKSKPEDGTFFESLLGSDVTAGKTVNGKDAKFTLTDPSGQGASYSKASNSFSIDGVNYTLNSVPTEEISFKLISNPEDAFNKIKDFVTKYNEMIDKINTKITEKKQYSYSPLTDDQKKDMKEDEIKRWEEKAKEGLLKGDAELGNMLASLRSAFFAPVEGVNVSLKEIGLDTSTDYTQKGKIVIDETKLKEALKNKGEEVANLFAKQSTSQSTYSSTLTSAQRETRYKEEGIFQRINDILKDYTRTTDGKGSLVKKAGIKGDFTDKKNTLTEYIEQRDKAIKDMEKKLYDRENKLYIKFAQLEKAMNQMNSQSSWLMQQFSGGQ